MSSGVLGAPVRRRPPVVPVPVPVARHRTDAGRMLSVLLALPAGIVSLAWSLPGLGHRALWNDEYATWYASTLSWGDLWRLLNNVDAVVAPYYVFMHGWIAVFGASEVSLRLPSALAVASAAMLTTMLGERLLGRTAGIAAGVLFANLPASSRFAQEARPYGLAIAATVLAVFLLLRAIERPTWGRWFGYAGALAAAGLAHVVAVLAVAGHLVAVHTAARARRDFRLLRWVAALGVVVTVLLPIVAKGSQETDAIDWIRAGPDAVLGFGPRLFGSAPTALVVVAAAVLAGVLWWGVDRATVLMLAAWALVPVVATYVTFPVLHLFLYRYMVFTLPAWCLLAATVGQAVVRLIVRPVRTRIPRRVHGPGRDRAAVNAGLAAVALVAALLVGAVSYLGLPGQVAARQSPVFGEPDFRAAAGLVAVRQRPGDGIAYAAAARHGRRAFAYELRHDLVPRDVFLATPAQELGTFGAAECHEPGRCVRDTARIWLIVSAPDRSDPYSLMPKAIAQLLRDTFVLAQRWEFPLVSVILLQRAG